jgi:hypothetical protein
MTPNQRLMLDRMEYPAPGIGQSVAEVFAPLIVFVAAIFLTISAAQGYSQRQAQIACNEIAEYYGVAADSDPSHRMLPPGVSIEYKAGRCLRTDNLTVITGNER